MLSHKDTGHLCGICLTCDYSLIFSTNAQSTWPAECQAVFTQVPFDPHFFSINLSNMYFNLMCVFTEKEKQHETKKM